MLRIKINCLGHKEKLIGNYQTIDELRQIIYEKYRGYLVKKNIKETRINFILTFINKTTCKEELLKDIQIITENNGQWFELSVKRIWDACCACLSSFSITSDQIPCECQNLDCGYQYCNDCVQIMKRLNQKDRKMYCMYCGVSSLEGPIQNELLIDLLWEQYMIKYGANIFSNKNIMSITLLNDIECRLIHLQSLVCTLKRNISQNSSNMKLFEVEINSANTLIKKLEELKEKFRMTLTDDIDENKLNDYVQILTGNYDINRQKCGYFISICEQLLYYNQKSEVEKYFPLLYTKMTEWEYSLRTEETFQPKIIEAFKTIESALGQHIIPSIPCRIGFIGNISVGKSSLLNWLRTVNNQSEENKDILISPVRVGKSTYCRLEFEYEYENNRKLIFVDIEGSTDTDTYLKSANYYDEIMKADCDLYIIVFDHQYTDIQQKWYDYIVNDLHRQCWLVRSKIDKLFRETFQEYNQQDFDFVNDDIKTKYGKKLLDQIQNDVRIDIHGKELPYVYLTFTSHDENLLKMSYIQDNLEKLLHDIQHLPLSLHENRLHTMAVRAMTRVINTCFRRGYVVNIMKYQIAAGIAAVIPLGDLIPRYFGREQIRQAFGVNTRSRFMNWLKGTSNEFEDYLNEFQVNIDGSGFKTSAFKNIYRQSPVIIQKTAKQASSVMVKGAAAVGVIGVSMSDDVIRGVGIGAVGATRVLSVSLIIVGGVLTTAMCAWAAVSNGKQMYKYLNNLCDDLILVSSYVTDKIIKTTDTIRDDFAISIANT